MDDFKRANVKDYTLCDLNCRHIVPHTRQRNKEEQRIKRTTRRRLKQSLKEELNETVEEKDFE